MANNVAVSFSLIDNFTGPMNDAIQSMMKSSKNLQSLVKDVLKGNKVFEDAGKIVEDALNSPFAKTGKEVYDLATIFNDAANDIKSGFMDKIGKFNTIASFIKNIKELSGTMKGTAKAADNFNNLKRINDTIIDAKYTISDATEEVGKLGKTGSKLSGLKKSVGDLFNSVKGGSKSNNVLSNFKNNITGVSNNVKKSGNMGETVKKFGNNISSSFGKFNIVGRLGNVFTKFGNIGKTALMGMTSPAFIVVAVIGAIAIAAFLIIKNWSKIKPFFMGIQKFFKPILTFLTSVFIAKFTTPFRFIVNIVKMHIHTLISYISGIITIFKGIITFISGVFSGDVKKALQGVATIFKGVFESIGAIAKVPLNGVITLLNTAIGGINKLKISLPDWLGGKSFSFNIPQIPLLAKGTNYWQGGPAMIHDRGAEIVDLPRGSRVYPHDKSIQMARAEGTKGKGNVAITIAKLADKIEVRSDKDIDDIVNKVANKFEKILNNTGEVVLA